MNRIPIACQLYSVHKSLAEDFAGTIRKVAEIGYEGVEFFGGVPKDKDADAVNAILKETGMKVCGWHSGWDDFTEENIDATIAFHRAIGNRFVVVPGLPGDMTGTAKAWRETAAKFAAAEKKLAANGIAMGYHNHSEEFQPLPDGGIAWDILGTQMDSDFILQMDNGNAMSGGADSLEYLRKYPGRARTIHLKPYSYQDRFDTMIGQDDVPWAETFAEIEAQGVTEWYIVEYESDKLYGDIEGLKLCYEQMKAMGK